MHNLLAGLIGFFVGLGTFFHGGSALTTEHTQTQMLREATTSGTFVPHPSGDIRKTMFGDDHRASISAQRPFLGKVASVNGFTLTVSLTVPQIRSMHPLNPSITSTITPPAEKVINIILDSSTKYNGGTQSDIGVNTSIAGIGKLNSDGSITAEYVQINPIIPTSFLNQRSEIHFEGNPMRPH